MRSKMIAVVCGGPGSEREVSLKTGKAVHDALSLGGYSRLKLIDASDGLESLALDRPDICFNALHGTYGEDGVLQGFLDMLGIAYTGSDVQASAVAYDKHLSKLCFEAADVPTPSYRLLNGCDMPKSYPCVVKPARAGSTIGISIVKNAEEVKSAIEAASKEDEKVIAESFIEGKELTISIFNGEAMPIIYIRPKSGFYDYESKYTKGMTEYIFEHGLSPAEEEMITAVAVKAYEVLGCTGVARTDVIYDGKTAWVLEVNTAPGMTATSLLPQAAARKGISFLQLLEMMLADGLARHVKQ